VSLVGFPTKKMHNKEASFELEIASSLFIRDQGPKILTAREQKYKHSGIFSIQDHSSFLVAFDFSVI